MGCFFANKKTHSDECVFSGAVKQIRTADLFLTKEVLCLLSYNSERSKAVSIFIYRKSNYPYGQLLFYGDPNGARTHDL